MAELDLDRDALTEDECSATLETNSTNIEDIVEVEDEISRLLRLADEWKEKGNVEYKQKNYEDALECYGNALAECPGSSEIVDDVPDSGDGEESSKSGAEEKLQVVPSKTSEIIGNSQDLVYSERRATYHCNRAACFQQLGKDADVLIECNLALGLMPKYVKALMRRGQAFEKVDRFSDAIEDMKLILEVDPSCKIAKDRLARLEKMEAARLEKLKEETMGKLKDLGNSLLGNFGLSTDNFKFEQDPSSGSYNIQFVQDPSSAN